MLSNKTIPHSVTRNVVRLGVVPVLGVMIQVMLADSFNLIASFNIDRSYQVAKSYASKHQSALATFDLLSIGVA